MFIRGYSCRKTLLIPIVVILCVGCGGGGGGSVLPPPDVPPSDTPPPPDDEGIDVTNLSYTRVHAKNGQGWPDLTPALSAYGYQVPSNQYVEIKDTDGKERPDMLVYYSIDQQSDLIYIKIQDPKGQLADSYEVRSIRDIQGIASVQGSIRSQALPAIAPLFSAIMKAYATYGAISSIRSLFSLEVYYRERDGRLVFDGTVDEFSSILRIAGPLSKLPVALKRNIGRRGDLADPPVTVEKAKIINAHNANEDLIAILKGIGGYVLANDKTPIRVTLNIFDGSQRYLDVEVLSNNPNNNTNRARAYNIIVTIDGCRFCSFEYDVLPGFTAPDFYVAVKVGERSGRTRTVHDKYRNVGDDEHRIRADISVGEEVEVIIRDEDAVFDDEISSLVFHFGDPQFPLSQQSWYADEVISTVNVVFEPLDE